ncbi:FkbM family methyltransferase [Crocosphaera sp. XPORK-15E]|uniref:FkbM family methyltransferase n=1 Tax=Crocosphaera sp. XPORK-15E TaxID=3110247 RepID=UPI002B215873|nr:FkbM family methyltransferase [Crocosphaera sp. XPORK-15E]MEA5532940.1 FkbM family methyltransferase [Crocosphaera sp. XPORK-15E]
MSEGIYRESVNATHKFLGKSNIFNRIAISLYFHTKRIFKHHLSDSSDISKNGEELIVSLAAKKIGSFVDVGANVGDWTSILLKYSDSPKKGILYEPSPTVFMTLKQKLSNHQGLSFRQVAVGEDEGRATLHENPKSTNVSSLISPRGSTEQTEVDIVSLDKDLLNFNIEKIDFLKIDTEGYDFQVLKGAYEFLKRQAIGLIQFEYSHNWIPASSTLKAAMNYLESCGYEVLLLKSDGLYSLNYGWYGEYFQYSNFLAISPSWSWIKEDLYRGLI